MAEFSLRLVCHGTRNIAGKKAYRYLVQEIKSILSSEYGIDVSVDICFLEHDFPFYSEVYYLEKTIFVPVFLSDGYHVQMDIASYAIDPSSRITVPLGPDIGFFSEFFMKFFLAYKEENVLKCTGFPLILAVAGSSISRVRAEYVELASTLEKLAGVEVHIWCANTQQYLLQTEVNTQSSVQILYDRPEFILQDGSNHDGTNIAQQCLAYLLIPGYFYDQAQENCNVITPPLVYCSEVHQLIISRFIQAIEYI